MAHNVPEIQQPSKIDAEWSDDHLGGDFKYKTLHFPSDSEGEVVATVVRKLAPTPTKRAVLYVHGFVDYFFQVELAEHYNQWGFNFYAVDLRKYGRSLRPHHTPNFCNEMSDYFSEIHAAIHTIIRKEDGNTKVLLNGHSTGGLTSSLFAHYFPDSIDALFLNSPFFDWNESWVDEAIGLPLAVGILSKVTKKANMPASLSPLYAQSVHKDHKGEWSFNLAWKPIEGFPIKSGWVGAIGRGQKTLQKGLSIKVPTLVLYSTESGKFSKWSDRLMEVDSVLDVKDIAKYADRIIAEKSLLTKKAIPQGMHDLILSRKAVRDSVYNELHNWIQAQKVLEA